MERAVSAELDNTATIITHTGLFDQVDKLYGTITGSTEATPSDDGPESSPMGGGSPPPPPHTCIRITHAQIHRKRNLIPKILRAKLVPAPPHHSTPQTPNKNTRQALTQL